jgi:hypothetical protein
VLDAEDVELDVTAVVPDVVLLVSAVVVAAAVVVSVCATLTDAVVCDAVSVWWHQRSR